MRDEFRRVDGFYILYSAGFSRSILNFHSTFFLLSKILLSIHIVDIIIVAPFSLLYKLLIHLSAVRRVYDIAGVYNMEIRVVYCV